MNQSISANASLSWENQIFSGWEIRTSWWGYFLLIIFLSLLLRAIMSALRASEMSVDGVDRFGPLLLRTFSGRRSINYKPKSQVDHSDYWQPTMIGTLELIAYPVLMVVGAWSVVGTWLGFKTLAQWSGWHENRGVFNRFLIGNALVVILSFALVQCELVGLRHSP